ncbi:MAG: hypothetical protein O3A01_00675 [bacterium]|nr:hypothetical protein [bacterium]
MSNGLNLNNTNINTNQNQNKRSFEPDATFAAEIAGESMVEELDLRGKKEKGKDAKEGSKTKKSDSLIQQMLGTDHQDAKDEIMQKSLQQNGQNELKKSNKELQAKLVQELENQFKKGDDPEDQVQLSQSALQSKPKGKTERSEFIEGGAGEEGLVQEDDGNPLLELAKRNTKNTKAESARQSANTNKEQMIGQQKGLKEYTEALGKYVVSQNPHEKQKMEKIKKELQKTGVTLKQIQSMETNVGQMVKQQYVGQLKSSLIKFFFSQGEGDAEGAISAKFDHKNNADALSAVAKDGTVKGGLNGIMEGLGIELRQELEALLYDETTNQFTKQSLGQLTLDEFSERTAKIMKAAAAAGVIIDEADLQKKLNKSIDDLGLTEFIPPIGQSNMNFREGDPRGKDRQEEIEKIYINRGEQLEDKLRNLYMLKSLNTNFKEKIDISFKMKRMKNGLIKLGVYTDEKEEQLRKEGELLAKIQLMDRLEGGYLEQATLHKLSGPAFSKLKNDRATIIRLLRKMGYKIKKDQMNRVRDRKNIEMAAVIREEISQLEIAMEVHPSPYYAQNHKILSETYDRIKGESKLIDAHNKGEPIKTSSIREAA